MTKRASKRSRVAVGAALCATLLLPACGAADPDAESADGEPAAADGGAQDGAGDGANGSVTISGSSTVEPISSLNAEKFREQTSGVEITVDGPGTGDGFELFCQGETDISDASRAIAEEEMKACEDNGVEYVELTVGIDGIAVMTSPQGDGASECLSFTDLYALLGPESDGFARWSDANGLAEELGDTQAAPYPDAPLDVFGPGEESGTFDSFIEIALEGVAEERGQDPTTRPDYSANADDNVIVQGIAGSPSSLGWVGYAFFSENREQLEAFQIDGGDGCVEPNDETIASGEYPVSRSLFIYVNTARAEQSPAVAEYVDFYLSDTGRESVSEVGYVELTDDEWAATQEAWQSR